jgi:hypothetical protein
MGTILSNNRIKSDPVLNLICFVLAVLASPFKSNIRLEAENAVVCTENLIRVDAVMESPKLAE